VQQQVLPPRMQDTGDADLSSQMAAHFCLQARRDCVFSDGPSDHRERSRAEISERRCVVLIDSPRTEGRVAVLGQVTIYRHQRKGLRRRGSPGRFGTSAPYHFVPYVRQGLDIQQPAAASGFHLLFAHTRFGPPPALYWMEKR
jgi:hypothetical protein